MASSHNNNNTSHSDVAKMEQIITEFYAKSLHIILESRTPYMSSRNFSGEQVVSSPSSSSSSSSSVRPRDKWFNLALRECPAALENLDLCRQGNSEPVVVDVILVQRPAGWDSVNSSPGKELVRNLSFGSESSRTEKIIERWVVQFESKKNNLTSNSGSRRSNNTLSSLYKKSILMLRSLYSTVRLLPAYKIFRDLNSSGKIRSFTLGHKVSSFVEPFTRKQEAELQRLEFTPVDTSCGRLCLSVVYQSSVTDLCSEPSTPITPRFIQDYVGSPLADPLKRFRSLPMSHGLPSSLPFERQHSWSFDPHRFPPMQLPLHLQETSMAHKQNTNYDEYYPSPGPSTSPSAPIHVPGSNCNSSIALLRSESAPVHISVVKLANYPALSNKQNLPPSPPLKITRTATLKNDKNLYAIRTGATVEKFSFRKEDTRRTYYDGSPHISFSKNPSRYFQDDFDDPEFTCSFDVEDDDVTDHGSRPESFDQKENARESLDPGGLFPIRKSQDAAVGTLVNLLKKAPPLRRDISNSINFPDSFKPEMWNNNIQNPDLTAAKNSGHSSVTYSGIVITKTTTGALEELQGYKEMKSLLLSQV
ncbi:hypothetical protein ACFE04_016042 [Oxalis oulophora]